MQPDSLDIRPEDSQQQPPQPPKPSRPRSIVTPAILIILGVTFLLSNFNLIGWDVWEFLWKLWPVWLIAAGLELIIGRRSIWGPIIALITMGALAVGGVLYTGVLGPQGGGALLDAEEISVPLSGATRANVAIHPSVGSLRVRTADSDALVDGRVRRLQGEEIRQSATATNGVADFRLDSNFRFRIPGRVGGTGPTWDLDLSTRVPMNLTIGTGVGESNLDLSGLEATRLQLDTGVGETTITLPGRGQYRAELDTGIGQTTVYIPRGLAARVVVDTGIGHADLDSSLQREGGYWVTPDYATAANRVDLSVDGGIGEIVIRIR